MRKCDDLVLRWTIGQQNTCTLSNFEDRKKYADYLWLSKLSIMSFQKWFPDARFVVLYNGQEYDEFLTLFAELKPDLLQEVEFVDQFNSVPHTYENPYNFYPHGIWWKWIPWRIDIQKHEIGVDTDIVCLSEPTTWYDWLEDDTQIVIAPDRFEKTKVNSCGDFHSHPLLKGKKPANCGIVGQKKGHDLGDRFFEITNEVRFGYTKDSLFVTEQGAFNLWIYSLELEGIDHTMLDFKKNAWVRDFIFLMRNGVRVETVHAVSWHKQVAKHIGDLLEKKVLDDSYDQNQFIMDVVRKSASMVMPDQKVISNQLLPTCSETEYF